MATKPAISTSENKATKAPSGSKAPRTLAGNAQHANDAARKSTLTLYESALKLMQAGKYEKAHEAFEIGRAHV